MADKKINENSKKIDEQAEKLEKDLKKLEETLIQIGLRIAKRGEGALFVVGSAEYKPLVGQNVPNFKAISNPKLLESLALMDGAVVITREGIMEAYGVMIKSKSTMRNFGTRHSAALSASKGENIVVLVSEEDKKVKILKNGKMVMQFDSLQKGVEESVSNAVNLLESIGAGTLGAVGAGILVPSLGVTLLPGIIVFGSAYYLGKMLTKRFY